MSQLLQVATRVLGTNGGILAIPSQIPPAYVDQGIPFDVGGTVQPLCKVYACDAYLNAALGFFEQFWPMDDAIGAPNTRNQLVPANFLGHVGVPINQTSVTMDIDLCVGELYTGGAWNPGSYRATDSGNAPIASTWWTSNSFTIGLVLWHTNNDLNVHGTYVTMTGGAGYIIDVRLDGIWLNIYRSGSILHKQYFVSLGLKAIGKLVIISVDMNTLTGTYTASVYGEGGLVMTDTETMAGLPPALPALVYQMNRGTGTAGNSAAVKWYGFKNGYSTAEEIQPLLDAWARNKNTYIDPNPNCIPP